MCLRLYSSQIGCLTPKEFQLQKVLRGLLAILLLFNFCWAMALTNPRLNQAVVVVTSRDAAEFKQALVSAYAEVLVKLSGNPAIMTVAEIQNSVADANKYLVSYSYQRRTDPMTHASKLYLHAFFDKAAIKKLLEGAGQTVWDSTRPITLILLSVDGDTHNNIISSVDDDPLIVTTVGAAKKRGLEVIFPVMDLQDQSALDGESDGELLSVQKREVMQRYQVKSILFGTIVHAPENNFKITWSLMLGRSSYQWVTANTDIQQAINLGMDKLISVLASHYATMSSAKLISQVFLKVTGVNGLRDYVKVVSVVRHLSNVVGVSVKDMDLDSLLLQVKVTGGVGVLSKSLRRTAKLSFEAAPLSAGKNAANLVYHWAEAVSQPAVKAQEIVPVSVSVSDSEPALEPTSESVPVTMVKPDPDDQITLSPYHFNSVNAHPSDAEGDSCEGNSCVKRMREQSAHPVHEHEIARKWQPLSPSDYPAKVNQVTQ